MLEILAESGNKIGETTKKKLQNNPRSWTKSI